MPNILEPIKSLLKQLKRLNATKRKVLHRDPGFNTDNLNKEISNLQKEIAYCKESLAEYYRDTDQS